MALVQKSYSFRCYLLTCGFFLFILGLSPLCRGTARAGDPKDQETWLRQHFSVENRISFRYRSSDSGDDVDFYENWYVQGRDLFEGRFDLYFSGRLHRDLKDDGYSPHDSPFFDAEDLNPGWDTQIYQLHGDIHDRENRFGLTLGRQYLDWANSLQIDGALVRLFDTDRFNLRFFYGRPVSYYSDTDGDWAGGIFLAGRLWSGNRTRLTYVSYEDGTSDDRDDQYTLDIWQRFGDRFFAHGRISMLNAEYESGSLDLTYLDLSTPFDITLSLRHHGDLGRATNQYSPLVYFYGPLKSYTYAAIRANWSVLPWLSISPGFAGRFVSDEDRNSSNREYRRYDLTLTFTPNPRWTVSLSGEHWNVEGGERFQGITGEVVYRSPKKWKLSLGSAYMRYRYLDWDYGYVGDRGDVTVRGDGTVIQVTPDVYTVFSRLKYKINDFLTLELRGEIEKESVAPNLIYGLQTVVVIRF